MFGTEPELSGVKFLPFLAAVLLFLATTDLPIGYYTFLRIVVTLVVLAFSYEREIKGFFFYSFIILAILFNAITPVHLQDKGTWVVIDFISGALLLVCSVRNFETQRIQ